MQRATRSNADNTLVQVEDPEQILRERRRSMAEQGEQGRGNPTEFLMSKGIISHLSDVSVCLFVFSVKFFKIIAMG